MRTRKIAARLEERGPGGAFRLHVSDENDVMRPIVNFIAESETEAFAIAKTMIMERYPHHRGTLTYERDPDSTLPA